MEGWVSYTIPTVRTRKFEKSAGKFGIGFVETTNIIAIPPHSTSHGRSTFGYSEIET